MARPTNDPPFILILKRKVIRIFPDGTKVAMYWNDKLKTSFAVPFSPENGTVTKNLFHSIQTEEMQLEEGVFGDLDDIMKSGGKTSVKFQDGSSAIVDAFSASALKKVFASMSAGNQFKFKQLVNKDAKSFSDALGFALKHSQVKGQ